ncbi:MAG: OmpH family outer membrane protein [Bacteroidaceae bacterium]|nr:OmpH family outer membrane protein [Bacteroidaceae bacterium]
MKKMHILAGCLFMATAVLTTTGCQQQASDKSVNGGEQTAEKNELKIAFVEVDSIMTTYTFAKEYADILKKKMETIQSTLNNQGLALQKKAAQFQNDIQQGKLTQDQAMAKQQELQKEQVRLQNLQESLGAKYQKEQDEYNQALHDSIQNFLKSYNKDRGYAYILSKSGDNILLADPALDITEDVIKGLNKRYKSTKKDDK